MRKPYEKPTITTLSTEQARQKLMDKNEQLLEAIKMLLEKIASSLIYILIVAGIIMLLLVVWWLFAPQDAEAASFDPTAIEWQYEDAGSKHQTRRETIQEVVDIGG